MKRETNNVATKLYIVVSEEGNVKFLHLTQKEARELQSRCKTVYLAKEVESSKGYDYYDRELAAATAKTNAEAANIEKIRKRIDDETAKLAKAEEQYKEVKAKETALWRGLGSQKRHGYITHDQFAALHEKYKDKSTVITEKKAKEANNNAVKKRSEKVNYPEFCAVFTGSESFGEVSEKMKLTKWQYKSCAAKWRKENGCPLRHLHSNETKAKVIAMLKTGEKVKVIAESCDVETSMVYKLRRKVMKCSK